MDPPTACLLIVLVTAIDGTRLATCGVALSRQHIRTQIAALALGRIVYFEGEHGDSESARVRDFICTSCWLRMPTQVSFRTSRHGVDDQS